MDMWILMCICFTACYPVIWYLITLSVSIQAYLYYHHFFPNQNMPQSMNENDNRIWWTLQQKKSFYYILLILPTKNMRHLLNSVFDLDIFILKALLTTFLKTYNNNIALQNIPLKYTTQIYHFKIYHFKIYI